MEDRYLYRAKRIDKWEWVEGLLTIMWGQFHIINPNDENTAYPIYQSTICQCTGLKDKNGKLIFENDLVEIKGTVFQCFWNNANFEWGFKNNSEDFGIAYVSSDDIRIVGNAFDNPELLEVGE